MYDVTAGSMYGVTLDSQSITASELQDVYDEVAALKESVTEENVYSEEYLGKLLNLAGKLYFAQVDIADTIASDMYDVAVTRSLSEGITGYEVQTSGLYGMITGIAEGSLYIDVDNDSHSVLSLEGDSDVAREYFLSTGMISSLYESTVWEEITGEESVSTISILAKASEENIDILLLSKANLSTEIEKLNTDSTTKQSIINAVNRGMIVTVPAEEVTMGDWSGTGYIVTNPETGVGEYMISGGLNGGSTKYILGVTELVATICSAVALAVIITTIAGILSGLTLVGCAALLLVAWFAINYMMWFYYTEYYFDDDLLAADISVGELELLICFTVMLESEVIIPLIRGNGKSDVGNSGVGNLTGSMEGLTADERTMVNDLLNQGKNVEIIPRDNNRPTPDFYVDGVPTELKTLNGSSLNTPVTRIQDGFKQGAETVIIDARKTEMTLEGAQTVIDRVVGVYNGKLPGNVEIWTKEGVFKY